MSQNELAFSVYDHHGFVLAVIHVDTSGKGVSHPLYAGQLRLFKILNGHKQLLHQWYERTTLQLTTSGSDEKVFATVEAFPTEENGYGYIRFI